MLFSRSDGDPTDCMHPFGALSSVVAANALFTVVERDYVRTAAAGGMLSGAGRR